MGVWVAARVHCGGMIDDSGCLFASWTVTEGRAWGEKDKTALTDDREGRGRDFTAERGKKWRGI